jgi:hypothetical protein
MPAIITSYDGTVRLSQRLEDNDVSDFLPFHKELGKFIGQDFKAAFPLESLPESFDKKINDLSRNFQKYKDNGSSSIETCNLIKNDLSELNTIVAESISKFEKSVAKLDDDTTFYNSTMIGYVENP